VLVAGSICWLVFVGSITSPLPEGANRIAAVILVPTSFLIFDAYLGRRRSLRTYDSLRELVDLADALGEPIPIHPPIWREGRSGFSGVSRLEYIVTCVVATACLAFLIAVGTHTQNSVLVLLLFVSEATLLILAMRVRRLRVHRFPLCQPRVRQVALLFH
jgi:hypothetical protein